MDKLLLLTLIIVGLSVILLSVGLFIKGKFVNVHIGGNKELAKRGIRCVTTQDKESRTASLYAVKEHNKRSLV